MTRLHLLDRAELGRLASLRPGPGQEAFVGTGAAMIRDPTEGLRLVEVRDDAGAAVGMFKLDPLYFQRHDFATARDLGLRSFLIDMDRQGQGHGGAALRALPGLARATFPQFDRVVLTVNLRNPVAYRAYLRAGFVDRGEQYLGGGAGPQHVLWLDLRG